MLAMAEERNWVRLLRDIIIEVLKETGLVNEQVDFNSSSSAPTETVKKAEEAVKEEQWVENCNLRRL